MTGIAVLLGSTNVTPPLPRGSGFSLASEDPHDGQALTAAEAGARRTTPLRGSPTGGAVGADEHCALLGANLESAGVDTDLLHAAEGPSGTAHIVVDDMGSSSIVVIPGADGTVTALGPGESAAIAGADLLLLQLELLLPAVMEGARVAHAQGVRTILTPSPVQPLPSELLDCIDLLIPNEHEAAELTGSADPRAAAQILLSQVPAVVVTLGSKGCLYAARGSEPVLFPAPEVTAVDTTGAGDTFVGTLAVALGERRPVPESVAWASSAAALCVQRPGASTSLPYRSEIDAA
ncbi:PfkB family carbohydrate kinase [Streptomyces atratus]|uniref:PfkB family carbohydrate kinase n=1 Tax=Streptomyces atratus TaxID=1893 RepID=UPI0022567222|nr:PfkB family carbohydrate kinase [Streptomyces atratus]MCX5344177.1 PfkB family carbohydrate kinase [Streptomyces atratus]